MVKVDIKLQDQKIKIKTKIIWKKIIFLMNFENQFCFSHIASSSNIGKKYSYFHSIGSNQWTEYDKGQIRTLTFLDHTFHSSFSSHCVFFRLEF